jgi:hypothetical protein
MAAFLDALTKIDLWIKTNGNKEITAAQLREILQDVVNAIVENLAELSIPFLSEDGNFYPSATFDPDENELQAENFKLQLGAGLINYIYNKGIFASNKERTLITKRYHDLFHKQNQWADISIIVPKDPGTLKHGDTEDSQTLVVDQVFLFQNPDNPSFNGLYIVGEDSSSKVDSWDELLDTSVIVLNPLAGRSFTQVLAADKSISNGLYKSSLISGYVKTISQLSIINNF